MGVNYGIRGGDILDLNQINAYIFNLEQSANVNIFLNTHHFNPSTGQNNISFVGYFSKQRLCVASVYVMLQSDTDPVVYPSAPTVKNIATNTTVTATKITDNKQVFNFKKYTIDYKIVIMRTSYSLSESNFYMKCSFDAINAVKNIVSTNYKLNQFLCWQEMTTKIDYARLSENATGVYTDFVLANATSKSAFAGTLINSDLLPVIYGKSPNTAITEFFNLANFSYEYLASLRFIFKKDTAYNTYSIIYSSYISPAEGGFITKSIPINMETVSDYAEFSVCKLYNIPLFLLAIEKAYKKASKGFKPTIIKRPLNSSGAVPNYLLGIVCENQFWVYPNISSTDSLNAATLYCTRQNANSTHNAANFHGEIGLDLNQNIMSANDLSEESTYIYPFFIVFKNGFFQTDKEFLFDYEFENGYIMKMGFTENLTT